MSVNSLKTFLTNVADAIRTKTGSTDLINPQDFIQKIENINPDVTISQLDYKDVNFYDYDGTLLYAYTKDEALALEALPKAQKHEGLSFHGWNVTLADVLSTVSTYGKCDIGANYVTHDGKSRFYIAVPNDQNLSVELHGCGNGTGAVVIDWGDGNSETLEDDPTDWDGYHTYSKPGNYCISVDKLTGSIYFGKTGGTPLMGTDPIKAAMLKRVEIGGHKFVSTGNSANRTASPWDYAFNNCVNLETISLPKWSHLGSCVNQFYNCKSLRAIIVPNYTYSESIGDTVHQYVCTGCTSLKTVVFPVKCKYASIESFKNTGISKLIIPHFVSTQKASFSGCTQLQDVFFGSNLSLIGESSFSGCTSLSKLEFRSNISTIQTKAFQNCNNVKYYDFTKCTKIPSLANSDAFSGINADCKIMVPYSLYYNWIKANNWSKYESNITMNYTPEVCNSLTVTADDVARGNTTTTTIRWTAVTSGTMIDGTSVENIELKGTETKYIGRNNEETAVNKEIEYSFMGLTETASLEQGVKIPNCIICKYNVTSTQVATQLLYTSFSNYNTYFSSMIVDGVETAISKTHLFTKTGTREVIFKIADGVTIDTPARMFRNCTALIYADCSELDFSAATATGASVGTAEMFYACSKLQTVILPSTISYMGYNMLGSCPLLTSLTINRSAAPTVNSSAFGTSSGYAGSTNKTAKTNKLYVPVGSTGYTASGWSNLYNVSYCGFTRIETDEI